MEQEPRKKLFATTYTTLGPEVPVSLGIYETPDGVDKISIPNDFKDSVSLCRFYYEHDGLAHTAINKQVEISINGFSFNRGSCTERELEIYEHTIQVIIPFLESAALEYLISGLIIPDIVWGKVRGSEISPLKRGVYELPSKLWIRDPMSIELKKTPIPEIVEAFVVISDIDVEFITSGGVYPDGTKDVETYKILVEQYPDFVKAVKKGQTEFKLESPLIIRRKCRSGSVWPTPYLTPALELLAHKRNLRKMDYAIASRVIQAVQLFRLGNDTYPLLEDDEPVVEQLKKQMQWRGQTGNTERIFQLFSNHTLQIDWVTPDVQALLDETKYRAINDDLMTALGLSRVIIAGENARTGTGDVSVAMLSPINSMEAMRRDLMKVVVWLLKQIRERNGFKGVPEPYCPPIRLQSLSDLLSIGKDLYENGIISGSSWAELGNFNYYYELEKRSKEQKLLEDLGLPIRPDVPFSPIEQPWNTQGPKESPVEEFQEGNT